MLNQWYHQEKPPCDYATCCDIESNKSVRVRGSHRNCLVAASNIEVKKPKAMTRITKIPSLEEELRWLIYRRQCSTDKRTGKYINGQNWELT